MNQPDFPYYNTVDEIFHADWVAKRLARQEILREAIQTLWPDGHPTKLVQVGGTAAKGSTCRFLELGFASVGKSGAFLSPHLFDYRERFSINGEFAARKDVSTVWKTQIRPYCVEFARRNPNHPLTYFQVSLLMALALFDMHELDWAAMEIYVGGRYDYTSALDPVATVLTNVGSDHAHLLGSEQWQRTLDKAGIARPNIPLFTSETNPDNLQVISAICHDVGAPLHQIRPDDVTQFEEKLARVNGPLPPDSLLNAHFQRWNATLALAVLRQMCPQVDEDVLLRKFLDAQLVGRFWQVEEGVYADIAHNAEKISALADEIEEKFSDKGKILVLGMSQNRLPREIFPKLAKVARTIIVTGGASVKLQNADQVYQSIAPLTTGTPTLVISEPRQAYEVARTMRTADDIIVLTGSTYMIEQVLNPDEYMRHLNGSYGWRTKVNTEARGTVQLTLPQPPAAR